MKQKINLYFLWLSIICVIAFILQNIIPNFTDTFILNTKALTNYQIWRFVTSIFLHGSITHLAYNLFALLFFGIILEKLIGSKKFLIIFFASGIIANIISVNFYPSSLGASGAIYGILGAIAIIRPMIMIWAFGIIMPMFLAAILWTIGDILGALGMFKSNTGYIAHLSGIAIGIITGIFYRTKYKQPPQQNNKFKLSDQYVKSWEENYMR